MAEDFRPNETSTLEVKTAAGSASFTSKRMSEWISVLSLAACCALVPLIWQLIKAVDALAMTERSEAAQVRLKLDEFAGAQRKLACLVLASDEAKRTGGHNCEAMSRLP